MAVTETLVAGRYRVIRALGAGGMGRVWLARDELLCRDVAIKEIVLPFGLPDAEREELRLRTLREARAAARLSHPNVVQIYDVQSGDEQPWIVMEYVRSRSLLQVIEENGPLPVEQVAGIGLAVLSALDAANRVGVLHRDVKPSNVLIADDGRVVLTDFGSAMIDEGESALTRTGVILGSPQYIAPERVDNGVSTPEADLWSLGATLYAAVEGRPPYTRSTTLRSLIALTTDKPDPTRLAGPLKPVLSGLLQRNPQARLTPKEVEQRLRRLADVQTTVHLRHIPEQRRPENVGSPAPAPFELPAAAAAGAQAGPIPVSPAPAPQAPITQSPITQSPITQSPITQSPITQGPITQGPITQGPITQGPISQGSASEGSTSPIPTSQVPAPRSGGPHVVVPRPVDARPVGGMRPYRPVRAALTRRRRSLLAAAAAVVIIPVAAIAASGNGDWLLPGSDPGTVQTTKPTLAAGVGGAGTTAPSAAVPSAATSSVPVAPAATSKPPFVKPARYMWWDDQNKFRIVFPANYSHQREAPQQMFFCAPGGPPTIRVRVWNNTNTDPAATLAREERAAKLPGYRKILMAPVANAADQAAIWEYTFTDKDAGPLHGVERAFVADGRTFLIQWRTPVKRWEAEQKTYANVLNSFQTT